jgi:hypothetical protein
MAKAFCQKAVRVHSCEAEKRKAIWQAPVEKGDIARTQSILSLPLQVHYISCQSGTIRANLFDRSPFGYLALDVLARNLCNCPEPFVGQLIDQG